MADRSLTLFELHLHEGVTLSATNTAPFRALRGDGDEVDEVAAEMDETGEIGEIDETDETDETIDDFEDDTEEGDESRGRGTLALLLLGVAVGAYLAVRLLRSDDDLAELEDLADAAVDAADAAEPETGESAEQ
jgi:hypothetical protein